MTKISTSRFSDSHLTQDPRYYLSPNRLDIGFKLLYLSLRDQAPLFAEKLYKKHIKAVTHGTEVEFDDKSKNNSSKFMSSFNKLDYNIKLNSFDKRLSVIPLAKDFSIANGAHRLSILIFRSILGDYYQPLDSAPLKFNYQFFSANGFSFSEIVAASSFYINYCIKPRLFIIWPSAPDTIDYSRFLPNVVCSHQLQLNHLGAYELLRCIYVDEPWIGTSSSIYGGISEKYFACFATNRPVKLYIIDGSSISDKDLLDMKTNLRETIGIGKHSCHSTDDKKDTIRLFKQLFNEGANCFFNSSSAQALSYRKEIYNTIQSELININQKINLDDLLVTGSSVLSMHGLRKNLDIDLLSTKYTSQLEKSLHLSSHDSQLQYYPNSIHLMLNDPKYHIYFKDLKVVSLNCLEAMKIRRHEFKDFSDLKLIRRVKKVNTKNPLSFFANISEKILYNTIYLRYSVAKILRQLLPPFSIKIIKFVKRKLYAS